MRRLGLALCSILLVPGFWACVPTRPHWVRPPSWPSDSLFQFRGPLSEANEEVLLETYAQGKVTLVTMVYARCPSMCPVMAEAAAAFQRRVLRPHVGADASAVFLISLDPLHDGPAQRAKFLAERGQPGWHFVTAQPSDTRTVAGLIGMRYDDTGEEIRHGSAFVLLGPDGRVLRRFADLNALREAMDEKTGWSDLRDAFRPAGSHL